METMIGTNHIRKALKRLTTVRESPAEPSQQYRFLVKSWTAITDGDLAARVLATEYFREQLQPLPLPIDQVQSILVLAPHQDDEVIGAGGTLLLASRRHTAMHILFTTDGEQREPGDTHHIRDEEALEVCHRLGATREYLGISNRRLEVSLDHVDRLAHIIRARRPDVILAPWLLDAPPKHRMVNHLLLLAQMRGCSVACEVWGYQVHNMLFPNVYVEITEVAEAKRDLIRCYRSQLEKYYRYDHTASGMAAWNSRFLPGNKANSVERYAEVFFALPFAELANLVDQYYLPNLEMIYKGKMKLIDQFRRLHEEIARVPA